MWAENQYFKQKEDIEVMQGQGNKIKLVREKLLLTQKEFADLIGVSRQTVNYWETEKIKISDANLVKVLEVDKKIYE